VLNDNCILTEDTTSNEFIFKYMNERIPNCLFYGTFNHNDHDKLDGSTTLLQDINGSTGHSDHTNSVTFDANKNAQHSPIMPFSFSAPFLFSANNNNSHNNNNSNRNDDNHN
jgi:hypothetical protein